MFKLRRFPLLPCFILSSMILGCAGLTVRGQGELQPKIMLQSSDRIVCFGDSVTRLAFCPQAANCNFQGEGWATLLRRKLKAQGLTPEIISAGVGGDTTVDLRARLERDVLDKKPTFVTLMVGLNDTWRYARDEALNPDQKGSVQPQEYEAHLREIVGKIKQSGARLLLCTPSLLGEDPRKFDDPQDAMNARLNRFAEIVRRVAREEKVPLLDVRAALVAKEREINLESANNGVLTIADGVHFNAKGQRLLADLMLGALASKAGGAP